jgi:hypothetical protein
MKKRNLVLMFSGLGLLLAGCAASSMNDEDMKMKKDAMKSDMMQGMPPFGDAVSVAYSEALWQAMKQADLVGASARPDAVYQGTHPHGAMLETLYDRVRVKGHEGEVIVKRNYGGPGITAGKVSADRAAWLKAVTVMFKREKGYDSEDLDWFWVKYRPDGSLFTNPKGMKLAGRVAKGMPEGCIACHKAAPGGDLLYTR